MVDNLIENTHANDEQSLTLPMNRPYKGKVRQTPMSASSLINLIGRARRVNKIHRLGRSAKIQA